MTRHINILLVNSLNLPVRLSGSFTFRICFQIMNTSKKPTAQAKKEQTVAEAQANLNANGSTLAPKEPEQKRVMPTASSQGKGKSLDTQRISFDPKLLGGAVLPPQMVTIVEAYYDLCDKQKLKYGDSVKVSDLNDSVTWQYKQDVTTVLAHYRKAIVGKGPWKPRQNETIRKIGSLSS